MFDYEENKNPWADDKFGDELKHDFTNRAGNGFIAAEDIANNLGLSFSVRPKNEWILTTKARRKLMKYALVYETKEKELYAQHRTQINALDKHAEKRALQILKDLKGDGEEGGIESSREEVTGLGGANKNRNFCNSGFAGGTMMRLVAA